MRGRIADRILLTLSALLLQLTAVAMVLTPFSDFAGTELERGIGITAGVLFWIGLVFGLALWFLENLRYHKLDKEKKLPSRPGILCFFTSLPACIADAFFLISLILNVVCLARNFREVIFSAVCAAVLIASFHLHYILNGKVYRYLKIKGKERKARERENTPGRREKTDGPETVPEENGGSI